MPWLSLWTKTWVGGFVLWLALLTPANAQKQPLSPAGVSLVGARSEIDREGWLGWTKDTVFASGTGQSNWVQLFHLQHQAAADSSSVENRQLPGWLTEDIELSLGIDDVTDDPQAEE